MGAAVNVNGRMFDKEHAVISVFDHGFLYGEGVYETLRTWNGRPFLFERHLRRLRRSAAMINLPIPLSDDDIGCRFHDTIRAAGLGGSGDPEAYIRLLVTRGIGDLTYDPAATPVPSVVVIVKPHVPPAPSVYEEGVNVALVAVLRNHPGSLNPEIKSNNLMNNALAMQEAIQRGAFEGVMRNYRGELVECTTSNLFVVRKGEVLTPPIEAGLLPGITREFVFEIAAEAGCRAREATLRDDDLRGADEAFLTSTTRDILAIVRVDDRPIRDGRPGPITRALMATFHARAAQGAR
jgi:branched-chain amino acid aminotransferase